MVLSSELSVLKLQVHGPVRAERVEREIINRAERKTAELGHVTTLFFLVEPFIAIGKLMNEGCKMSGFFIF